MITSFYAPSFDIRISGLILASDISNQVISLTYENNLDMADMFSIVLRNADNLLIDSALCDLGKNVEIYMGYGNDLRAMMLGEITAIEPSFPESGTPTLHISGYDRSYKLRNNQPEPRKFENISDSGIAVQIAAEAGLIPVVDPSPIFHKIDSITQTGSDMALLKERAQANYFDVYVYWDKLYFQFPRPQTEAYVLEWGKNLSSYEPRISSAGLAGLQVVRGYNEALAQTIVAFALAADLNPDDIVEKMGSTALDLLLSLGRRVVRHQDVETSLDAKKVAVAIMQEILEGMYEGSGQCVGNPDLRAGRFITIQGVGKRFSGQYRMRKVTHTIDDNGYRTSFDITQKSTTNFLSLLRKSQSTPPSDKNEPFYGVTVGKVVDNNYTGEKGPPGGKVRLSLPDFSDEFKSDWARCVTPLSGDNMGMFFLPAKDSEVLVAFEGGNVSKPIVLGGLWNGTQGPPREGTQNLDKVRLIKTNAGHTIMLDDTQGSEKIVITDKGGSKIMMSQDGNVSIEAKVDMTLKAGCTITLDAKNVNVKE